MDNELREAFSTLSAQMSDIGNDARRAAEQAREAAHETYKLGARISGLETDVGQLKTAVFGSNPPPAPVVAVVKRITHTEGDIAEIAGQVIAVKAELSEVKSINEEQSRMLLANTTDTIAIRREVVDGLKGFWKRHPKLETALVAFIMAVLALGTAFLTGRMH
jgi:hypothetical protein